MTHDHCVAIAAFGGTASGFVVGWVLSLRFARLRAAHRRHVEIMRQGGVLYVDRDQAVGKHINSLRRMVRPGNRH